MRRFWLSVLAPAGGVLRRQQPRAALRSGRPLGRRLLLCCAGNTAVEFALAAPVLILMMLASAELARFVILHQKMDRVATTISDLVSRAETINESQMQDIFTGVNEVAYPYDLADLGVAIVSSVTNPEGNGPIVAWQRSGGGALSATSQIGTEGEPATLSGDFVVREGETAIIAEVFFDFEPFLSELIVAPQTVYRTALHRPRLGTLQEIEEG